MQVGEPDQEERAKRALKKQLEGLHSGHRSTILETISSIRADSQVSILPSVFELLADHEDEEIRTRIAMLLNDLKLQEAAPLLAEAVNNPDYSHVAHILAAACWQNGLSYGPQAAHFVRAAIEGTYQTAVESFTVLEEAAGDLAPEERMELIRSVDQGMSRAGEQKELLLQELKKVLEQY